MDNEVVKYLLPCISSMHNTRTVCVDATVGIGGHSLHLLSNAVYKQERNSQTVTPYSSHPFLYANDVDSEMLSIAQENLKDYAAYVQFYNMWFDDFFADIEQKHITVQAILFDLGLSMYHFLHSKRGFSWKTDEYLDMRLNKNESMKAFDIVNTYTAEQLSKLIFMYGEERQSVKWAKRIVLHRQTHTIYSVSDLCTALQLGKKMQDRSVLARIFQSFRIETNRELERIQKALPLAWNILAKGGRLAVISFHSLEDRIVKHFSRIVQGRLKKSDFFPNITNMYCNSGKVLHKKPLVPSDDEVQRNNASRSAKLRVLEKII